MMKYFFFLSFTCKTLWFLQYVGLKWITNTVNRTVNGLSDIALTLKIKYCQCERYKLNCLHMKVHHQGNKPFKLTQLYLFPPFTNCLYFGWSMYFIVTLQLILLPNSEIVWLTIFRTSDVMSSWTIWNA